LVEASSSTGLRHEDVPAVPGLDQGKVERFNGYLRRSFYLPLASRRAQGAPKLDAVTANVEVTH
jgi:transposase